MFEVLLLYGVVTILVDPVHEVVFLSLVARLVVFEHVLSAELVRLGPLLWGLVVGAAAVVDRRGWKNRIAIRHYSWLLIFTEISTERLIELGEWRLNKLLRPNHNLRHRHIMLPQIQNIPMLAADFDRLLHFVQIDHGVPSIFGAL